MNNFLEEFIDDILCKHVGCAGFGDMNVDWDSIRHEILNVGENTSRMLSIGTCMDELVKLGFEKLENMLFTYEPLGCKSSNVIFIDFNSARIYNPMNRFTEVVFDCDSPTLQQDLLGKVKGIISNE